MGRCIVFTRIRQALLIHSFIFHFFFLSNFQTLTFSSHFSQELWDLEDWNLAHTWTVDRCIVYTEFRLLLFNCPYISSFFFLSNFQTFKNFSSHFSQKLYGLEGWNLAYTWTVSRCIVYIGTRLLLLTHPFIFIFLSLQFSKLNIFVTLFSGTVRPWSLKLGTHVDNGPMYCVYRNQATAAYLSLCFFIFFPSILFFFCFSNFQFMICLSPQIAL